MLPTMPAAAVLTGAFLAHPDERLARFARTGNRAILALVAVVGAVGVLVGPGLTGRAEDAALLARWEVQAIFATMFVAGTAMLLWDVRGAMEATARNALSIALCFAIPMTALVTVGMPLANEEASTARLVRVLANTGVPGGEIAMYHTPHLWTRDMPGRLDAVRQGGSGMLRTAPLPRVVVVRSDKAGELGSELFRYELRAQVRMIGKSFDVYQLP
jgi:hypothetical protein